MAFTSFPRGNLRVLPHLVGRDEELKTLLADLASPAASYWLIDGPGGIGKSRLLKELDARLGGSSALVTVWTRDGEAFGLTGHLSAVGQPWPPQKPTVIFVDPIDRAPLDNVDAALEFFQRRPLLSLVVAGRNLDAQPGWRALLEALGPAQVLSLPGLTEAGVSELIGASGALRPWEWIREPTWAIRAASNGNPRMLLEWLDGRRPRLLYGASDSLATVLGPDGRPLGTDGTRIARIELRVSEFSEEFMVRLARDPDMMRHLSPRQFEELVAELYQRAGAEVELTRAAKDGGFDVYAWQKAPFGGKYLTIIECKRNRVDRPIEVGLIRQLYGTVMAMDASVGVLATTSYFSKGARAFQAERPHRLGLQDFVSLKDMLRGHFYDS